MYLQTLYINLLCYHNKQRDIRSKMNRIPKIKEINLISQTSAVSPPTRKVSKGPYTNMGNVRVVKL